MEMAALLALALRRAEEGRLLGSDRREFACRADLDAFRAGGEGAASLWRRWLAQIRGSDKLTGFQAALSARPFAHVEEGPEGAISADGRMMGAYVHGAFANDAFRRAFLKSLETEIDTCTQFRRHPWNLHQSRGRHPQARRDERSSSSARSGVAEIRHIHCRAFDFADRALSWLVAHLWHRAPRGHPNGTAFAA